MAPDKDSGLVDIPSNHSVDKTVEKLKGILQAKELLCSRWSITAEKRQNGL